MPNFSPESLEKTLADIIRSAQAIATWEDDEKVGQFLWILRKGRTVLKAPLTPNDELASALTALIAADCEALEIAIEMLRIVPSLHLKNLLAARVAALVEEIECRQRAIWMGKVIAEQQLGGING